MKYKFEIFDHKNQDNWFKTGLSKHNEHATAGLEMKYKLWGI